VARRLALVGGVLGLSFAVTASAVAQQSWKAAGGGVQIGPVAGVNIFTLSGSDAQSAKSRTAFYGGVALNLPLGSIFFVQPEALYAQKGAKWTDPSGTLTAKLAYVEVPILLGLNFGTAGSTRPRVYAGPTVGVNLSCDYETSAGSVSCGTISTALPTTIKTLDLGVTGGGGLSIPFGRATFTLDARYTLGLTTSLTTSTPDGTLSGKNQGFAVGAGIMIRFGGK